VRPNIDDEVIRDLERLVDEVSAVDPDVLGVEAQLKILFSHAPDIDETDTRDALGVGENLQTKYQ
jgi:hypothetical protein